MQRQSEASESIPAEGEQGAVALWLKGGLDELEQLP